MLDMMLVARTYDVEMAEPDEVVEFGEHDVDKI